MDEKEEEFVVNISPQKDTVEDVSKRIGESTAKTLFLNLHIVSVIGNTGKLRIILRILSDYLAHTFKGKKLR